MDIHFDDKDWQEKIKRAKKIVIAGGGFGGFYAALQLEKEIARDPNMLVILINHDNFFLFTPFLHEVACGDIDTSHAVNPMHKMLRHVKFLKGTIDRIDPSARSVSVAYGESHRRDFNYDHLVLALGSEPNFFNTPGVEDHALTMKSLSDAIVLRDRVLDCLESANVEPDPSLRQRLLTFVLAGGGFAGVETIASINDFVREAIAYYPNLAESMVKIFLIHPSDFILPELGEKLGRYTAERLMKRKIEILLNEKVVGATAEEVRLRSGKIIPARTLIWTAGVRPDPLLDSLPYAKEHGRILVNDYLEVADAPGVWAVGDCAAIHDRKTGTFYPPTAQHAMREGIRVAANIKAALSNGTKKAFVYRDQGRLAAIGKRTAVANIYGVNFSGYVAFFLWRTIYWVKMPRWEKKLRIAIDWTLDLFFSRDLAQYLTQRKP